MKPCNAFLPSMGLSWRTYSAVASIINYTLFVGWVPCHNYSIIYPPNPILIIKASRLSKGHRMWCTLSDGAVLFEIKLFFVPELPRKDMMVQILGINSEEERKEQKQISRSH